MTKILLVEDDQFFREVLGDYLKSQSYSVVTAADGRIAKNILSTESIDLVLSDIQMPHMDGLELFKWSKENKPTKFIIMTGFSNVLETQSAYDLGIDEFLSKPFKNEELDAAISKLAKMKTETRPVSIILDDEFCKVSIDGFVTRPKIEFDVYVRLSSTKYIKIGNQGDSIPTEQINAYKSKGLNHLHIKRGDFGKLVDFNMEVTRALVTSDKVSQDKKLAFMKYTGEVLLEKVYIDGLDKESFNDAKEFLANTVSVITESKTNLDLIESLNKHSDHLYAHSLGVSLYAMMIGRKMGLQSNQSFFRLSMAGLFHDIGKKELPRELLEKPRPLLSQEERTMWETHVTRSMEILSLVPNVPEEVIQMVYEHHEDNLGHGFPRRKNKHHLQPLSKILIVANIFVETTIKSPSNPGMPSVQALAHMEKLYGDRIDSKSFMALKGIFSNS